MDSVYIYLTATEWSQEIRSFPSIDVQGRILRATCTVQGKSDVLLYDGLELSAFGIQLSLMEGELDAEHRTKMNLSADAIGGLWYNTEQQIVHGWFHLTSDSHAGVWEQVRDGGYAKCAITLGIAPVEYKDATWTWRGQGVSIEAADVRFTRKKPVQQKPAPTVSFDGSKMWSVSLFMLALVTLFFPHLVTLFFPQWNGIFLEPSRGVTAGDARIVAAVLFVGGLLLWFKPLK
jgi:hypothetical protein